MLSFAWNIRDRSALRVMALTVLLMLLMGGFFLIFRIGYPVMQRADAVPQRVLILDPADPASLAIIHRAQDKSFGLVPTGTMDAALTGSFPAFKPSFSGSELKLRRMISTPAMPRHPRIFSAATSVLPAVAPRAALTSGDPQRSVLKAVPGIEISRRAPAVLEVPDVPLADPENARFRIALAPSGQVLQALPLFTSSDPAVMEKLRAHILGLRFQADPKAPRQWGTLGFQWQTHAP